MECDSDPHCVCFCRYTGADDLECDSDPHCVCVFAGIQELMTWSVSLTPTVYDFAGVQELMTWRVILTPTVCVFLPLYRSGWLGV